MRDSRKTKSHLIEELSGLRSRISILEQQSTSPQSSPDIKTHFLSALDNAEVGVWHWDLQTDVFTVNAGYTAALGIERDKSDISSQWWRDLIHPDDQPLAKKKWHDHYDGVAPAFDIEYRVKKADGSWIWFFAYGHIFEWLDDGTPAQGSGTFVNITARKQAEALLRLEKDLSASLSIATDLETALNHIVESVYTIDNIDTDGIFLRNQRAYRFDLMAYRGLDEKYRERVAHIPINSRTGRLLSAKQPHFIAENEITSHIPPHLINDQYRSIATIPINYEGIAIASLVVSSTRKARIPLQVCDALESIAVQAGDVIARLKSEEALRTNEQQLSLILRNTREIIYSLDPYTWNYTYISPYVKELLGYDAEEFYIKGEAFTESLFHPEDVIRNTRYFNLLFNSTSDEDVPCTHEYRMRDINGKYHWISDKHTTIRDHDGTILGFIGCARDITREKETMIALEDSELKLWTIINSGDYLIFMLDLDHTILEFNDFAYRYVIDNLGMNLEKGASLFSYMPDNSKNRYLAYIDRVLNGETVRFEVNLETIIPHRQISDQWYEFNINPTIDKGRITGFCIYSVSVTARKKAEQALSESEQKYRSFVEQSCNGIALVNSNGILVDWNRSAETLTGITKDLVLGKSCGHLFSILQPCIPNYVYDVDILENQVQQALITGNSSWFNMLTEVSIKHSVSGTIRTVEVIPFSIKRDNGIMIGVTLKDISEQKKAEEIIRNNERQLRMIIDMVPHNIFVRDIEGRMLIANKASASSFGKSVEEVTGSFLRELYHKKDEVRKILEIDREIITTHKTRYIDKQVYENYLGEPRIYQTTKKPVILNDSGETAVLGVSVDITDMIEIQEKLRTSEQKYRDLVENATDVLFMADVSGIISYISMVIESLYGYRTDEVQGQYFGDFIFTEDRPAFDTFFQETLLGYHMTTEVRFVDKQGHNHWVRMSGKRRIKGNKPIAVQGIIFDINTRKQEDQQIVQYEELIQRAFKATSDGIWEIDLLSNKAFVSIFNGGNPYNMDIQLPTTGKSWAENVHPEDIARILQLLDRCQSMNGDPVETEFRIKGKNNVWRWIYLRGKITARDSSGNPIRMTGCYIDISERKKQK